MKYGLYLPNFGEEATPQALAEMAMVAEQAGWEGLFLWDHMQYSQSMKLNVLDPWITLAAVAARTKQIRFGTTVTPLSRRRPWRLARETATLDILSGGRLTLSVGLGDPAEADFANFGEEADARRRAERLDEGLEILTGLWTGKPFSFHGKHYQVEKARFLPVPLQKPRIPIWVGGFWPNKRPFLRAARWDGVLPLKSSGGFFLGPQEIRDLKAFIRQHQSQEAPFDIVIIGTRPRLGKKPAAERKALSALEQAGATWWLQSLFLERNSMERMRAAILQGPPG